MCNHSKVKFNIIVGAIRCQNEVVYYSTKRPVSYAISFTQQKSIEHIGQSIICVPGLMESVLSNIACISSWMLFFCFIGDSTVWWIITGTPALRSRSGSITQGKENIGKVSET